MELYENVKVVMSKAEEYSGSTATASSSMISITGTRTCTLT